MQDNKKIQKREMSAKEMRGQLKLIGSLSRAGMNSGNKGDMDTAFDNLEDALSLAEKLNKNCLLAKLLNNMGILYLQAGSWDKAMLNFDKAMHIVCTHYGTQNYLFRTLQKNIGHLFNVEE